MIKCNKAFKYRLKPNSSQEELIQKTFGCCRFIYNKMLADKIEAYRQNGINLRNTPAQYKKEYDWLKEVDSYALCNEQMNLQSAYNNFFRSKKIGFPKFKSKKHSKKSYTTSNVNNSIRIENEKIHLSKLGFVKIIQHRRIPENFIIKSATIIQTPTNKYFVSVLVEYYRDESNISLSKENSIGLDYSSHDFYVDNFGNRAKYPKFFRIYSEKLAKEQRKLSNMMLHSKNYEKQRLNVAKVHEKILNCRKDFLHKLSYDISNKFDYVFVEDIDMKNISQALKLGKSTMDNGFGMFRNFLQYKLNSKDKQLIKIGRFMPTSIVCSTCGCYHKDIVNSLSVREWVCPDCMTHHDRDINAAINIRNIGLSLV